MFEVRNNDSNDSLCLMLSSEHCRYEGLPGLFDKILAAGISQYKPITELSRESSKQADT